MTPIYKAMKIDSTKYVEGWLYADKYIFKSESGDGACIGLMRIDLPSFEIDTSTIQISFDNGETWDTLDKVYAMISFAKNGEVR